jgi:hypothetical protein
MPPTRQTSRGNRVAAAKPPPRADFDSLPPDEFEGAIPAFADIMRGGVLETKVESLPMHLRFARLGAMSFLVLFMIFAFILLLASGIVMGSFVGELLPSSAAGASLVLAVSLGIISSFAFVAVKQRLRSITLMCAIFLAGITVAQIAVPAAWVVVQPSGDDMSAPTSGVLFRLESLLAMSWSTAAIATRQKIQLSLGCCGAFDWPQNCYAKE